MNRLDGTIFQITTSDLIDPPMSITGMLHLIDGGWNGV
jgi:hypothetical protein